MAITGQFQHYLLLADRTDFKPIKYPNTWKKKVFKFIRISVWL